MERFAFLGLLRHSFAKRTLQHSRFFGRGCWRCGHDYPFLTEPTAQDGRNPTRNPDAYSRGQEQRRQRPLETWVLSPHEAFNEQPMARALLPCRMIPRGSCPASMAYLCATVHGRHSKAQRLPQTMGLTCRQTQRLMRQRQRTIQPRCNARLGIWPTTGRSVVGMNVFRFARNAARIGRRARRRAS